MDACRDRHRRRTGKAGVDDFGIDATNTLIVSQRALDLVNETEPVDLDAEPIKT